MTKKMCKLAAGIVLALACAGSPCMAKQPNSTPRDTGKPAQKAGIAKKTGKKPLKGRRGSKKSATQFWTKTRVLVTGVVATLLGGGVYWYLNQEQMNAIIANIREKLTHIYSGEEALNRQRDRSIAEIKTAGENIKTELSKFEEQLKLGQGQLTKVFTEAEAKWGTLPEKVLNEITADINKQFAETGGITGEGLQKIKDKVTELVTAQATGIATQVNTTITASFADNGSGTAKVNENIDTKITKYFVDNAKTFTETVTGKIDAAVKESLSDGDVKGVSVKTVTDAVKTCFDKAVLAQSNTLSEDLSKTVKAQFTPDKDGKPGAGTAAINAEFGPDGAGSKQVVSSIKSEIEQQFKPDKDGKFGLGTEKVLTETTNAIDKQFVLDKDGKPGAGTSQINTKVSTETTNSINKQFSSDEKGFPGAGTSQINTKVSTDTANSINKQFGLDEKGVPNAGATLINTKVATETVNSINKQFGLDEKGVSGAGAALINKKMNENLQVFCQNLDPNTSEQVKGLINKILEGKLEEYYKNLAKTETAGQIAELKKQLEAFAAAANKSGWKDWFKGKTEQAKTQENTDQAADDVLNSTGDMF